MAGPWEKFQTQQAEPEGPWAKFQAAPPAQPEAAPVDKSYSGSILPFSSDASGNVSFDSNAGIVGSIKRAITLPRDVYDGKVDLNTNAGADRVLEMATTVAPVNPAIRIGERAIPGPLNALTRAKVEPPSAEALKAASKAGYNEARDMGVDYSSAAVKNVAEGIQAGLEKDGVLSELAPKSFSILKKLQDPPADSVATISGLEAARRSFGHAGKDFTNPTEQMAAQRAREGLDTFLEGSDPSSVVAGPAADAAKVMSDARGNYAAASRSEKLSGIEEAAELRAAAANSGQNSGNAARQRIVSLLLKPKEVAGFSEGEVAQLESVARGSKTGNTFRAIGNLLGGGGGLGGSFTSVAGMAPGAMAGSPTLTAAGAALPLVGYGAKRVANALTERGLSKADRMTRERSPLHEKLLAEAPMIVKSPAKRAAVIRALMLAQGMDLEQ